MNDDERIERMLDRVGFPSVTPKRRPPLTRDERIILLLSLAGLVLAAVLVIGSVVSMSHAG